MTRIRQNRYKLSFGSYVGVIMDEELMRKMARLQYETKEKILELLENHPDHHWNYSWGMATDYKNLPNDAIYYHYIDDADSFFSFDERLDALFDVKKLDHVYKIGDDYVDARKAAEDIKAEHDAHVQSLRTD